MSRTITALYDSRADAEAARARLTATNIDADNVRIVDQESHGGTGAGSSSASGSSSTFGSSTTSGSSTSSSSSSGGGFWASIKDVFVPDEDRHSYDEGIRRGGVMLYASIDEDDVDRAVAVLEETGSVDMDERESSWRSEGWSGYSPAANPAYGSSGTTGRSDYGTTGTTGRSDYGTTDNLSTGNRSQEEHIQLAEEELHVGKREVNRGGARVRTYVTEKPVTEQVTLREEHVNVERRPVSGTTGTAGVDSSQLFQERTVEMTETAEEAVVSKQARVTEELVVSKTADQRTETISDTVRKTEVDIDRDNAGSLGGSSSALDGRDDPNRGPLDRAGNALDGHDDSNRGPLDRASNALGGHDDPNRGPLDRASNTINRNT